MRIPAARALLFTVLYAESIRNIVGNKSERVSDCYMTVVNMF